MGKNEQKPAIRFQGFTDAWEQRKLGDTFDFLQNNTLSRADLDAETGVAKNVHYGDVLIKFGEYLDASSSALPYIPSQQIVDKFKGSLLQDGDVIMADTAEDEAVGKCTEIAGLQGFPTISGLHTIPLRPKEKSASGYLGYYMNSGSYHNQLLPLMQGIKVTSVSKSAISNTDISFPYDRDEQAEIGGFFIRLDNLITLHQCKYLMFPAFSQINKSLSDTLSWEQRKLGECFSERVESDPNGELISVTIGSGIKKFSELGRHDNSNDDKSKYKKVVVGDIAYNSMRMWQGASGYSPYNGIVSPAYTVITPFSGIDSKFFAYMFKREDMIHTFQIRSQGITSDNWNLKFPTLSEIPVMLPITVEEQTAIAGYLTILDTLITLHQRQRKNSMRNCSCLPFSWEQRKLGEVGKARSGVGFPDTEQGGSSGTPFFKVSDMNNDGNENEMNVANNYVTDAQIAARRWSPIEEVPAIFFAKVGAAVMLNRKRLCRFPFLLDNNTMAYSLSKDQWDADFAKALFETVDLTTLVQVGALPSYNASDVEAMEIMLPEIPEQRQIGAYFRQLDNLITLHQC